MAQKKQALPTIRSSAAEYLTFVANELQADSVIRHFRITAKDGKNYNTHLYESDFDRAIEALGRTHD
jgi:hypothetical protein